MGVIGSKKKKYKVTARVAGSNYTYTIKAKSKQAAKRAAKQQANNSKLLNTGPYSEPLGGKLRAEQRRKDRRAKLRAEQRRKDRRAAKRASAEVNKRR